MWDSDAACRWVIATRWTNMPTYPLKPPHAGETRPHPFLCKIDQRTRLQVESPLSIARCLLSLVPPSMNRVEFQLFLINSLISSLSVPVVSLGVTSRLFIEFSFLDFHIDHTVIDIRIRSLSESLVKSSLKDNAEAPLTRPVVIAGHCLSVVFVQMLSGFWISPYL